MRTPSELALLAVLRKRGQCPTMTVFVTDNWKWADKLEELGCLAIRVRDGADAEHDWSPLAGLSVMLLQQKARDYAALGQAILAANPSDFETFEVPRVSRVVCGGWLNWEGQAERNYLLIKHLWANA